MSIPSAPSHHDGLVRSPLAERSRTRARLWRFTRNRRHLYRLIVNAKNDAGGREFVGRDCTLVIDGFERSGNTFAYLAFLDANPEVSRIGHHTHSPAQFYWASKWNVPTLLLLREPSSVALSVNLRWPGRTLDDILEDYIGFHERVLAFRADLVVAPFEMVTNTFGRATDAVNARFATAFKAYDADERADQRVFSSIERRNAARYGQLTEVAVARPSVARRAATDLRRNELERPQTRSRLDAARSLHDRLLESTW